MRARELRGASTDAELLLWSKLRARQLAGLKFRRQRPIGPYFADFACVELGLVIELDGGQHGDPSASAYDTQREEAMRALSFTTLRFWDNEVINETQAVLEKIWLTAQTLTPALSRKREREQQPSSSLPEREREQQPSFSLPEREREQQPSSSLPGRERE